MHFVCMRHNFHTPGEGPLQFSCWLEEVNGMVFIEPVPPLVHLPWKSGGAAPTPSGGHPCPIWIFPWKWKNILCCGWPQGPGRNLPSSCLVLPSPPLPCPTSTDPCCTLNFSGEKGPGALLNFLVQKWRCFPAKLWGHVSLLHLEVLTCRLQSQGREHVSYPDLGPRIPASCLNFQGGSPLFLSPWSPLPLETWRWSK